MRMMTSCITYLTLTAVLAVGLPLWAGKRATLPPEKVASFAIPKMTKAPVIDGKLDPAEWRESMVISGAVDQYSQYLIPRPTSFYLAWDDDHLYFGARTYIRKGYKPKISNGRSQGLAYVFDEGMELGFKPMGRNVAVDNAKSSYKLFLNCLGYYGDCSRVALGQQYKNWAPKFKVKSSISEEGTAPDGGSWFELELSATTKDFELTGKNRVGDEWRFMLGFNHLPMWMQARIPCVGPYLDPSGYCRGILVENKPAIQMTMDSLKNLASDGTASLNINAFNPSKKATDVEVNIKVGKSISKNKILKLAPGKSAEFVLNEKLPKDELEGPIEVAVTQGKTTLLSYNAFFKRGLNINERMLKPVKQRDPSKFAFKGRFNPARSWLHLKADSYYLPDPDSAKSLSYSVFKEGSKKPIATGKIDKPAEWYFQTIIKLPKLVPGNYSVEGRLQLKDGTILGPVTTKFVKKDEAKEFARWWGKKYGNINTVIPPYTAITQGKTTSNGVVLNCVGREYTLNALGLPAAMTARNGNVLSAPAKIIVTVGGKETSIPMGKPKLTKINDWRVDFTGSAHGAGLDFEAKGWLEQDGLVYVDLTYKPSDNKPVVIDSLRIEYPLSEQDADGLLCIGPGANFSSRSTILLDKKKQGPLWSTLDTGITGSGMTIGSFYPTVWIGSERRGLLWWADHDKGWVQKNDVAAHEAIRKDGAVVLTNNIVGRTVKLTGPKTLSFSYIATPFKPLPKGFRATQSTEDGTFFQPFRNVRMDSKTGKPVYVKKGFLGHVNWIHPESRYPEEWDKLWEEQRTKGVGRYVAADKHVKNVQWRDPYGARSGLTFTHISFQIMGYGRKSLENDTYAYFGSEWELEGRDTWNESYTDYAMSLFDPAFKKGGIRSTYWDLSFPMQFKDPLSGLAYFLPDGRVQRGYNGWNIRRFMMRLYALQSESGLVPGGNGFHSSNAFLTIAMPWTDAVLDGERDWNLDTSTIDWVDAMPIQRMRSMSVTHSWGVPICWMANMHSKDRGKISTAKRLQGQWIWMHDSWLNPYVPQLRKMPDAVLDWGVNDEKTVFYPYWRNPYVTSSDKDVLVSLWHIGDRVMLGIFNYAKGNAKNADLKIDLAKLGLNPQQTVLKKLWSDEIGYEKRENNRIRGEKHVYKIRTKIAKKKGLPLPKKPDEVFRPYPDKIVTTELSKDGILKVKDLPGHRLLLVGLAAPDSNELSRTTKALPEWVKQGVVDELLALDMIKKEAKYITSTASTVSCDNDDIQISMWQLPDRIMLMVFNNGDKNRDAKLKIDIDKLGLTPKLKWQEFIGIRQLQAEDKAPKPVLDFHGRTLTLKRLKSKKGRVITIRKY